MVYTNYKGVTEQRKAMGVIKINPDSSANGYVIVENTDELLYVIAQLLLDAQARIITKQLLTNQAQEQATTERFHWRKHHQNFTIELFDNEQPLSQSNPLQIIVSMDNLDDIIDAWELYTMDPSQAITITREHDSNIIQLFAQSE
jgi:hypothetical protein